MFNKLTLRKTILSFACCFAISILSAQNIHVRFKIVTKRNEPVSDISISISKESDSVKSFIRLTDSLGMADFNLNQEGQYFIKASALNYKTIEKNILITNHQNSFVWVIESASNDLQNVTVVSKKPLMKQEDDKTIVEPENLALASSNSYEVLEKVPGLFIDQDGNIYLSSNTPATVYINGRDLKMSTDDMATLLKNLPPNAIAKIEILRTPSAKYDASGSGGVVNVILRKGVRIGTTGSATTGWQQGIYANKYAGFSLNNNNSNFSNYINANISNRSSFDHIVTNRIFATDSLLSQNANTTYPSTASFLGYGLSYNFNNKWTVNYDGRLTYNNFDNVTTNSNSISKISTAQILSNDIGNVANKGYSIFANQEISSLYKIDSSGSEWTNDISYTYSGYSSNQNYINNYTLPSVVSSGGNGAIDNHRNMVTLQTDLKLKLEKHITVESGLKSSILQYNSGTNFFKTALGITTPDAIRTNTFVYKENINAGYLQVSKGFGEVVLKVGTRIENTNMDGQQIIPSDTTFKVSRTDFFPYIYLSKPLFKIEGFELKGYLVYRRSITRPSYDYLNPFAKYIDQYTYEVGNPNLKPQFTQNYEANVSVDERPIVAVGYNNTENVFNNVMYPSDSSKSIVYKTYDNLGSNKEIYFRALGALPPGGKYFFVLGTQYNHIFYNGLYNYLPLAFKRDTWTIFTYHNLKLGKLTTISISGFARFNGVQQFYDLNPFGSLNTSISRKLLKEKLTLTLNVNDIFYTQSTVFSTHVADVNASGSRNTDSRRIGINLRYNFGFNKKEEKKNMFNEDAPEK